LSCVATVPTAARKYDTLVGVEARAKVKSRCRNRRLPLVGVVQETMQSAHVSLWLRPDPVPQGGERVTSKPSG
jgi:hypothetical protein